MYDLRLATLVPKGDFAVIICLRELPPLHLERSDTSSRSSKMVVKMEKSITKEFIMSKIEYKPECTRSPKFDSQYLSQFILK